jgi:hypothetical protein
MFYLVLQMSFISAVFTTVKVRSDTVFGTFKRDMVYEEHASVDTYVYGEFSKGICRIQCALNCLRDHVHCRGVLYNKEQKECKLLRRTPTMKTTNDDFLTTEWEHYSK